MRKEKVLIVEDELDLLDLVDFNLTRKGFVTAGALDGAEAMEKIESFGPDLVVLDLMLPKVDGWEICRDLKSRNKDIPVIMLTAKSMPEDKVKGLECGADDYITKPFNIKELVIRIDNLLEKKRAKDLQGMLVHEMRNRLSTIGCYSERLIKKSGMLSSEKQSAYLRNLNAQVAYTADLISEIGTLIDVDSGVFSLKAERCDILNIVTQIAESYKSAAEQKHVNIEITADDAVPEILANNFAVRQVFTNLIGNAVKYNRENGFVGVTVKVDELGIIVGIRDNGIGILEGDLPFIFEKGYRAGNVPEGISGSGLGLYISKKLIDKLGAGLTYGSVKGAGSVFTVFFRTNGSVH